MTQFPVVNPPKCAREASSPRESESWRSLFLAVLTSATEWDGAMFRHLLNVTPTAEPAPFVSDTFFDGAFCQRFYRTVWV